MQIDRPIVIIITLFVILVMIFYLVLPEYKAFGRLQVELGEKTAEYNAQVDYYATIESVYADLQGHQEDIKQIDNALPTEANLGKLIYYIQDSAKGSGILIKSIFLSSPGGGANSSKDKAKELSFSVQIVGDYVSLYNFIVSLEKSARIFEITNITFGAASGAPEAATQSQGQSQFQMQQTYNFSMQIKTYSY